MIRLTSEGKNFMKGIYQAFIMVMMFTITSLQVDAQLSKFNKPASFSDIHTVYTYQKSNWDGSHASFVFLYISDTNKLESFKWAPGYTRGTLVSAAFDWSTFSVQTFTNHGIDTNGKRQLFASLAVKDGRSVHLQIGDFKDSMWLENILWHSYDFDFAGLSFAWRALENKRSSFSFLIADAGRVNGKPAFENKGSVNVEYSGEEMINGKNCLKYTIDGPGLQNKGGIIWVDPRSHMIVLYRIALPDEEGFINGQLRLIKKEKMPGNEWDNFINEKMRAKQ